MKVLIETSARHVHLCSEDIKALFGKDAELIIKKGLSQTGEYACTQRVNIVGPKGQIENVGIIGPQREKTQVEISLSDARKLGINAPVRLSGDIESSAGCRLVSEFGIVDIQSGVIAAKRHVHIDTKTAMQNNIKNRQNISVKITTESRSLIFNDVIARVSDQAMPAMHIDTDESNAAGISGLVYGEIIV